MKYLKTLPLLRPIPAFMAMVVLFASCSTLPKSEEFGPFVRRHTRETIPARENKKIPRAELNFALLDVTTPGALQTLVWRFLYDGQTSDEYARLIVHTWEKSYLETVAENPGYAQNWGYEEKQKVALAGSYAVITRNIFTYEGGAHPNHTEDNFVISLETPRQLRLSDLITRTSMSRLDTLADWEFRRVSQEMTGEPLPAGKSLSNGIFFSDTIPLTGNFYPDAKGLNFHWDPAEIAAYAAGEIKILITWQELYGFLSPEGRKLADAFTAVPPNR